LTPPRVRPETVPLRDEKDEHRRNRHENRRRRELLPGLVELEGIGLHADRQRVLLGGDEDDVGERDLVPRCDERVEAGDGETRRREGHHDPPEGPERGQPVDPPRLLERDRDQDRDRNRVPEPRQELVVVRRDPRELESEPRSRRTCRTSTALAIRAE